MLNNLAVHGADLSELSSNDLDKQNSIDHFISFRKSSLYELSEQENLLNSFEIENYDGAMFYCNWGEIKRRNLLKGGGNYLKEKNKFTHPGSIYFFDIKLDLVKDLFKSKGVDITKQRFFLVKKEVSDGDFFIEVYVEDMGNSINEETLEMIKSETKEDVLLTI